MLWETVRVKPSWKKTDSCSFSVSISDSPRSNKKDDMEEPVISSQAIQLVVNSSPEKISKFEDIKNLVKGNQITLFNWFGYLVYVLQ